MIRVLRGRVIVREDLRADTEHYRHIIVPDVSTQHDPDAIAVARTWHRGTVLAMGAPALTKKGVEVPHGFAVGDQIYWHFVHNERSWTLTWIDGERAVALPQSCIDAVHVEPARGFTASDRMGYAS
jgi:co-chaperonin GroES (HSP10)